MITLQKRWPLFSAVMLAISAGWIGFTAISGAPVTQGRIPAPQSGFLAPDFELADDEGNLVRLSNFHGQAVIVNFWASWCPPCRAEMPALQAAAEHYAGQGLVMLAVNATHQDSRTAARGFFDELDLSLPVLWDESGQVNKLYQVRALPTTFFIGPDGVIHEVVIGGPLQRALIESRIEDLLEER